MRLTLKDLWRKELLEFCAWCSDRGMPPTQTSLTLWQRQNPRTLKKVREYGEDPEPETGTHASGNEEEVRRRWDAAVALNPHIVGSYSEPTYPCPLNLTPGCTQLRPRGEDDDAR